MKLVGEDVGGTQTHISLSLSVLLLALSLLSLLLVVCFFHRGTNKSASLYFLHLPSIFRHHKKHFKLQRLRKNKKRKEFWTRKNQRLPAWNFVENLRRCFSPRKKSPVFYSGEKCSLEFPQNLPSVFFQILRGGYFLTKSPAFAG